MREFQPLSEIGGRHAVLVEESEQTVNDGNFVTTWAHLASRHRVSGYGKDTVSNAGGHVLYGDGHVDCIEADKRIDADDEMWE